MGAPFAKRNIFLRASADPPGRPRLSVVLRLQLYGRLPGDTDRAPMHDPTLGADFRFDVAFIGAANVHYITVRK
jgi:hypothetical protein